MGLLHVLQPMKGLIKQLNVFFLSEDAKQNQLFGWFFLCLLLKFLWFDLCWCMMFTFRPFSEVETYLSALFMSLIFLLLFVCFRMTKTTLILFFLLDILFVTNLMYSRTYYTTIPLDSYGLLGNLEDFTDSVYNSLRWMDVFFPLSTCALVVVWWMKFYKKIFFNRKELFANCSRYLLLLSLAGFLNGCILWFNGGFKVAYESLQDSYTHTCATPMYTVFGTLYYDYICGKEVYTPEVGERIETWLAVQPAYKPVASPIRAYDHCVLILLESFESWVLEMTMEGCEVTPCLNRLLKDSTTLFAPHVLSQVKGGHSIDAQLIFNTGLLPINNGVYSLKYPYSHYPSLAKAMKEKYRSAKAYALTVDKPVVWNQNVIVPQFGYDSLIGKFDFVHDELTGPRYRPQLSDVSFFRQCAEKMKAGEVWEEQGHTFLQCATYSGHFPFTLPDALKQITFSEKLPSRMRDYLIVANYTDRALGEFIDKLRADIRFQHTLIVITGDHEALTDMRTAFCESEAGRGVVSDKPYTPLIILNAPTAMRYEPVMGQIDIYPTLLQLLGLDEYVWKGIGQSILDPDKKGLAVSPLGEVYGDTTIIPMHEIQWLKDAWEVSDQIIRYDYLKISGRYK